MTPNSFDPVFSRLNRLSPSHASLSTHFLENCPSRKTPLCVDRATFPKITYRFMPRGFASPPLPPSPPETNLSTFQSPPMPVCVLIVHELKVHV